MEELNEDQFEDQLNIDDETQYPDAGYYYILSEVEKGRYEHLVEQELSEAKAKLDFVKGVITKKVKEFKGKRQNNKVRAFIFTTLSTALAAIVTVLLGWSQDGSSELLTHIALIISAIITVVGVFQKFWDAKDLWVRYTLSAGKLESLLFTIEYLEKSENALRLRDVEYIKLKFDQISEETTAFVVKVRSDDPKG